MPRLDTMGAMPSSEIYSGGGGVAAGAAGALSLPAVLNAIKEASGDERIQILMQALENDGKSTIKPSDYPVPSSGTSVQDAIDAVSDIIAGVPVEDAGKRTAGKMAAMKEAMTVKQIGDGGNGEDPKDPKKTDWKKIAKYGAGLGGAGIVGHALMSDSKKKEVEPEYDIEYYSTKTF